MKRVLLSTALSALFLAPLACDLEKTGQQLTADHVMVGTLLATPEVEVFPLALAGFDAGTQVPDAGGAVISLPAQTAALIFIGSKNGENSQPSGVAGAKATLQPVGGQATALHEDGSGSYSRTNVAGSDPELAYQSGATYQFIAARNGTRYVGQVDDAPVQEKIAQFHPAKGFVEHPAGTPLAFDRAAVPGNKERTLGFVTVVPLSSDGEKGDPTYSTMPTTPMEFLQLVAMPGTYREARITIPGSAFLRANQTYLVIFNSVRLGGAESDNLFIGSALLAGIADVGIIRTH
ncbi:hypothetical protein [Myxococcus stipitatus]|uniref:hypothetical protein n=1 Tax=Myxococcus stipitatus TaxID=83455 RepID=UPI0030CF2E96